MKKLIAAVTGFAVASVFATLFIWWDTAPAKISMSKYRLGQQQDLGIIVREPIQPGPAIWKFECVSESEKDCPQTAPKYVPQPAVVRSIPEPGTFALIVTGLLALFWRSKKRKQ